MTATHAVWIGLGSNLDLPAKRLDRALAALAGDHALRILAVSRFYQTTPVGGPAHQPDYCNACAALATRLEPLAVLDRLQAIENAQQRVRDQRWGPRTLDLDVLAFDDRIVAQPRLCLPHPRAHERAFVLVPLAEIAPALVLAGAGRVCDCLARVGAAQVAPWPGRTCGQRVSSGW